MKSNLGGLLSKIIHSDENIIHSNILKNSAGFSLSKIRFFFKI